jgi:hypothetical protein
MQTICKLILVIFLICAKSFIVQGQCITAVSDNIEKEIKSNEKDWQIEDKNLYDFENLDKKKEEFVYHQIVLQTWKSREDRRVSIMIFVFISEDEASSSFKKMQKHGIKGQDEYIILEKNLAGLPNESHFWRYKYLENNFGVVFRSNKILVVVGSSTENIVKQFSTHLFRAIQTECPKK